MKKLLLTLVACISVVFCSKADNINVYWENNGWSKVCVHYWGGSTSTEWPGDEVTTTIQLNGKTYFQASIPDNSTGVIFNNDSGQQTANLTVAADGTYNYSTNSNNNNPQNPNPIGFLNSYNGAWVFSSTMYLAGEVGTISWNTTQGLLMTTSGDGIYTLQNVEIKGTFGFVKQISVSENDWNNFNASSNRFGPSGKSIAAVLGSNNVNGTGDCSWSISTLGSGNYDITYNTNTKTMTLARSTVPPTYPDQMYMIGIVGTFGSWNPTNGLPMEVAGDGVYTLTNVPILGNFAFASKLGANDGDWNTLNANRYGPVNNNTAAIEGQNAAAGTGDRSWSISKGGNYDVTFDLANKTMTLTASTAAPTYPDQLYIIGSLPDGAWKTNVGVEMTKTAEGKFKAENVTILDTDSQGANFSFCTQLSSETANWNEIGSRYGSTAGSGNKVDITSGETFELILSADPGSFSGTQGTYTIEVDLTTMKMTATWVEVADNYPSTLYIIGEVNGVTGDWLSNNGLEMKDQEDGMFTLENVKLGGDILDKAFFSFTESLATEPDDWDSLGQRYGAPEDKMPAPYYTEGGEVKSAPLQKGENAYYVPAGVYNFTVKFEEDGTISLTLEQVSEVAPETLYLVGKNVNGVEWGNGVEMTYANGVYTWTGEVLGTDFKINNGSWNNGVNYGSASDESSYLTLDTPYSVTNDPNSKDIQFENLSWIQDPTVTFDPIAETVTVTGTRPMYLRGVMTLNEDGKDWSINPSYLCSVSTNAEGQTVYTLSVASIGADQEFKFGTEDWVINYGNGETDLVANNPQSYDLAQGGEDMAFKDSWLNVTFTLTVDKEDASKAYLMITGTQDTDVMVITFGNDKTNQSGSIVNGVYTISRAKDSGDALIYVYPPQNAEAAALYYKVTPTAETSALALEGYTKAKESGDGGYVVPLPEGKGEFSVYYTDNSGTDSETATYNYAVTIETPTGIDAIGGDAEEEAVYYNLQGVRVENPQHGIYVKVVGNKATKVVL